MKRIKITFAVLFGTVIFVYSGIIATNEDVPLTMDSDQGVAADMATYILDNYDVNNSAPFVVGENNPYNHLIMRNGSVITNTVGNWIYMRIGQNADSSNNIATITGEGTELVLATTAGAQTIYIGSAGGNNTLEVLDGARLISTNTINMGSGGGNRFIIDNATVEGWGRFYPCMSGGLNNYVSIRNGGRFNMPAEDRAEINASSTNLWMEVRDFGSVLNWRYMRFLGGYSNRIVMADEGLIQSRYDANWVNYPSDNADVCFYGFAGGYFAQKGTQCRLDWNAYIRLWDGNDWVEPSTLAEAEGLGWSKTYYSDDAAGEAAALAATGYSGLAGYEVYTGGEPMYPTPPSGTCIIIQ